MDPQYEIWIADLGSLYDLEPMPSVFAEDCFTLEEAIMARGEWQTHDTAAWIVHKESGQIAH